MGRSSSDIVIRVQCRAVSASIGPITSAALRAERVEPAIEAERYTTEGLVDAIHGHFSKPASDSPKPEGTEAGPRRSPKGGGGSIKH